MKSGLYVMAITGPILLSGCAGLDFGEDGLTYFEPTPHLFVAIDKNCLATATVISLPGKARSMKFKSGLGSADLSVVFADGMLTNVGQKTDTKIPDTLTSIAALQTSMSTMGAGNAATPQQCNPTANLYTIKDGALEKEFQFRFQ